MVSHHEDLDKAPFLHELARLCEAAGELRGQLQRVRPQPIRSHSSPQRHYGSQIPL